MLCEVTAYGRNVDTRRRWYLRAAREAAPVPTGYARQYDAFAETRGYPAAVVNVTVLADSAPEKSSNTTCQAWCSRRVGVRGLLLSFQETYGVDESLERLVRHRSFILWSSTNAGERTRERERKVRG